MIWRLALASFVATLLAVAASAGGAHPVVALVLGIGIATVFAAVALREPSSRGRC